MRRHTWDLRDYVAAIAKVAALVALLGFETAGLMYVFAHGHSPVGAICAIAAVVLLNGVVALIVIADKSSW